MRVSVLPLGPINVGNLTDTPFLLIIDQIVTPIPQYQVEYLRITSGARAVWTLTETLDVVNTPLTLTKNQSDQLIKLLTKSAGA